MRKKLVILGATGSIGQQALDIVERYPERFELVGLSGHRDHTQLLADASKFGVNTVALSEPAAADLAQAHFPGRVLSGPNGLIELIAGSNADIVLNGIVGSAGLTPTIVALAEGIDVALANKESLVVGGELVMALAEGKNAKLLPVDSEHSALFQLAYDQPAGVIDRLVLTASGGPFRGRSRAELEAITPAEAVAHPTWSMGQKISVDSATLINKGLELIEAHHLFGMAYERMEVVVHPQSIIHSMVDLCDGATLAHLGYPDMRVPISYAINFPERVEVPLRRLDLVELGSLTFEAPDEENFGCLRLARESGAAGGSAPAVLNAANEVAVSAFLNGQIGFLDIERVIDQTLDTFPYTEIVSLDQLIELDNEARRLADDQIGVAV